MVRGKKEISFLHEDIGCSAENLRVIAFAEFREEDADGLGFEALEGARDETWLIAEFFCGSLYSLSRGRGNGAARCIVQDKRDGCRTEVQVFCQHLQADAARNSWQGRRLLRHKVQSGISLADVAALGCRTGGFKDFIGDSFLLRK